MSTDASTQPHPPSFPKLNEHNYHTWKYDIQALLQRNGTWAIVKGSLKQPAAPADPTVWNNMNWNAAGIIYSQVEPKIQPLIRDFLDSAKGM